MTIYIILDVDGNVPQHAKPYVDIQAALAYFTETAKKYGITYDFEAVINNPSASNIKKMRLSVNKSLNKKDNGDELHWIEEDLLSTLLFEDPTGAKVSKIIINLLSDLEADTSTNPVLHDRIGFSKYLLQKYPFTDMEVRAEEEWQTFISNK
ncbi:hypothetical protein A3860_17435 [Niastella vici]|uniref:Uncharacterized protein n=1 Tax=Niastella vici TaxID=1703345 RepID=A0A1V9G4D2_9BACT|nr:hypothetical protein [Niastella vici]OQP65447.1 hypothetical protein A3860_17435 [Niastella vici]